MKTLYLIGGTMGVGKTTTCQVLKKDLEKAVFLDGDWCWDADPFQVTDETCAMVVDNIIYMLNNFLHCSAYENVIFGWVMHQQSIIDSILSKLDTQNCRVKVISLVCTPEALAQRLAKDVAKGLRQEEIIARSIARLPLYEKLNSLSLDVSAITPEEAAQQIAQL